MRAIWVWAAAAAAGLTGATPASAQAIVPPRGEGTVSVTFQNYRHTGHFDLSGKKNTNGATESQVLITHLDFGVTDTFGLSVSLPFIASKYTGPDVYFVAGKETRPGPIDDRTYHGAFQDLRIEARRVFVAGRVAIAPFVGVSLPTHNYETEGEAVPGRHRTELQLGVSAGTEIEKLLPGTEVQMRYSYATLERVEGFAHTRSNIDVEVGHGITSRIDVHATVAWQIAHTGPAPQDLFDIWEIHDRLINSSFFNLSGGVSFALLPSTDLFVAAAGTLKGKGGAHVARVLAIGVSRSFGGGFHGIGR